MLAALSAAGAMAAPRAACAAGFPAITLEPVSRAVWWVPAHRGDSSVDSRGQVSNLLVVRDGDRVWLLGSGPSPAFGRALGCRVRAVTGRAVSDIVTPWAQPELALGTRGFPGARRWAHADVAMALRARCPDCVQRLRERLGSAAVDLGQQPAPLPGWQLRGRRGRLGPFDWWQVARGPDSVTTLWHVRGTPVLSAHGLLWTDALPRLRDANLRDLVRATEGLRELAAGLAPAPLLIGEQGPPAGLADIDAHLSYWRALARAIADAQARGADATLPSEDLPGVPAALLQEAAHSLNWQRAWRQAEEEDFERPRSVPQDHTRGGFQRSLR